MSGPLDLDLRAISRDRAACERLRRETENLVAEQRKRMLVRDRWLPPLVLLASVAGGIIGSLITHLWPIGALISDLWQ